MLKTSRKTLVYLAAGVWYIGGVMLFRSGWDLLRHALEMRPESNWHWLFIILGIVLGAIQAATLFSRCRRRSDRRSSVKRRRGHDNRGVAHPSG